MNGDEAYVLSKALTAAAIAGIKNYNISDSGLLTMETASGEILTYQFNEPVSATVTEQNHLILSFTNGTEHDCGEIVTLKGDKGDPGEGIPKGGSKGQVLTKKSGSDYDAEWKTPSGGGGGGSAELSEELTAAISVGGITSGKSYEEGTPLETIFRDMLEPTLYPSFTAPSASITYGANQYYPVGGTVAALTATVSLNRGTINPSYGTSGYRAGVATGYAISTSGADTEYSDSGSGNSFSVPALTRTTKGTIVVTGTASYAEGEQPKDSKGNDYNSPLPAGSKSAAKTLTFIQPYYYGVSNSASVSDFTGLTENVTAKGQKTFNYTTNNQYMVFAYDASYGNLKTILDGNGFDVTGGWTKSSLTVNGFSYYVYVSNSPTTDTNAPFTFKY